MKHRWRQVDYREITERESRDRVTADFRYVPKGTPKRIVAALVVEWCSRCGRLRRQWLRGSDGSVFQTKIIRPSGVGSGNGCPRRPRAAS